MTIAEQLQQAIQETVNYVADQRTHGTPNCADTSTFMASKFVDLFNACNDQGFPVTLPEGFSIEQLSECTCDIQASPESGK